MKTKRLLALVLSLCMLLTLIPAGTLTAFAEDTPTTYKLYVGGTQVTFSNADDVFDDGKVKYDPDNNTLTLNGYTYEGEGYNYAAIYYGDSKPLNLELAGASSVTHIGGLDFSFGVYALLGDIDISGSGNLTATAGVAGGNSYGVFAYGSITVSGGETVAQGATAAFNKAPTIDEAFSDAKVWYGENKDAALATGVKQVGDLTENYNQKYVRIAAPLITGISIDTTSSANNAGTNTFTVTSEKPFVAYLTGDNFDCIDDDFLNGMTFGFVPSVENSENALCASLFELKEFMSIDADKNTITLTFGYEAIMAFLGDSEGFEGICFGDTQTIKDENIKSVNIVIGKANPTYTHTSRRSSTTTTTIKNDDGSTTKTTTNKSTGTVTEMTTYPDGSTTTVETKKDGTKVVTETNADGKITATVETKKETEVTIPVENADEVTKVVVTDENGVETEVTFEVTDGGVAITVSGNSTVSVKWEHICYAKDLTDVDITAWYHESLDYCLENGLMKGTASDKFAPNDNLTRAMLVTILYRAEGEPTVSGITSFADLEKGQYYLDAVCWAQVNGIVNGTTGTTFAPNSNITREQFAAIMHRYATYKGHDVSVGENTNILSYDDVYQVSEYAIGAMQYAVGSGLIKGKTEATLNPLDNATRTEAAAILERFFKANK